MERAALYCCLNQISPECRCPNVCCASSPDAKRGSELNMTASSASFSFGRNNHNCFHECPRPKRTMGAIVYRTEYPFTDSTALRLTPPVFV
jgi:hypothetical protein